MRTGPNVFLRSDGRWEARYQKGRDEKGKMIYGFVYGKTQDEAERKRADALRKLNPDADMSDSMLASVNPNVGVPVVEVKGKKRAKFKYDQLGDPLEEETATELDSLLSSKNDPTAISFYLSLHMGLSISECVALRYGDIDLTNRMIRIHCAAGSDKEKVFLIDIPERNIPLTKTVFDHLNNSAVTTSPQNHFIFSDSKEIISSSRTVSWTFRKFVRQSEKLKGTKPTSLRSTFVKRCLDANMNIESVAAITGIDKGNLYKYYGRYIKPDVSAIHRLDNVSGDESAEYRKLNLLILGAGSHGHNVKETAQQLGIFKKISFLDDNVNGTGVVGTCKEFHLFTEEYPCAFVAIGDNETRKTYAERLRKYGFMLPTIIHPDATVSPQAEVGEGSVIFAQATVNVSHIGDCCIVSSNALVNFGATIGNYTHLSCGAMVMKNSVVPESTLVESGEIYRENVR